MQEKLQSKQNEVEFEQIFPPQAFTKSSTPNKLPEHNLKELEKKREA